MCFMRQVVKLGVAVNTMKIIEVKEGSIVEISVKPRSKEFKVSVEDDGVVVYCTEEPVKGKVNKELIRELSRLFHRKVEIVSGFTSKEKRILVTSAHRSEIENALRD